MAEATVNVTSMNSIISLFGKFDENVNIIQRQYGVVILSRGNDIRISGEEENVNKARAAVETLAEMADKGEVINDQSLRYIFSMVEENSLDEAVKLTDGGICVTASGKVVKAKTLGQKKYVDAIGKNTIVMGIGPAGTGKTYLAVAMAVKAFKNHEVTRIILTRPAVEAGEKLGFLPGDLQNKVDPYLRPLYDALFDMMGAESFAKYMEKGSIEVAPLAYMRGRTLDDAFIILDEAQNTTREQIKMFLTRLGFNSKMVITGDITQIDLPDSNKSGLIDAMRILKNVDDIAIMHFTEKDVVRHKLVQDIIRAYEKANEQKRDRNPERK
ncbi:MAG: PhoH family protein [Huintestinicola sp.]